MSARALVALAVVSLAACGGAPDENSGGDSHRNEAEAMPLDEWVTGQLNADDGDTTDWKSFEVDGTGKLSVELKADKKNAVVHVGVFDKYGQALGNGTRKGDQDLKVQVKAASSGRYFVRITHKDGDKTTYSLRAVMGDEGGGDVVPDL